MESGMSEVLIAFGEAADVLGKLSVVNPRREFRLHMGRLSIFEEFNGPGGVWQQIWMAGMEGESPTAFDWQQAMQAMGAQDAR